MVIIMPKRMCGKGQVYNEFLNECVDAESIDAFAGKDLQRRTCLGKFEGNYNCLLARAIYDIIMDGGTDEQIGDVGELGWFGRIDLSDLNIKEDGEKVKGVIVSENDMGSFSYASYDDKEELDKNWKEIEKEYDEYFEEYHKEVEAMRKIDD